MNPYHMLPPVFGKARAKPVQHEQFDCITFNATMDILAPRYDITYTHIPGGGMRHKKTAADMKAMGYRAGVWDYYIRALGKPTLWLEFKHGKNTLTSGQVHWRALLQPMGDLFEIVYSPLQALEALTRHGFLPQGAYFPFGAYVRVPININA